MLKFKIYRSNAGEPADGFDMGDIEFAFDGKTISSRASSRLSSMLYVSIADLIDGLLHLKIGGKSYVFIGADSSFNVRFEKNKHGINILHGKSMLGPISFNELLEAINHGIDAFLSNPHNKLPADSPMYSDFNASRSALRDALI